MEGSAFFSLKNVLRSDDDNLFGFGGDGDELEELSLKYSSFPLLTVFLGSCYRHDDRRKQRR